MALSDMTFLNTRPAHQSAALSALLRQEGVQVIECPTMQIVAHSLPTDGLQRLKTFQNFDALVITSVNALLGWVEALPECFSGSLSASWPFDLQGITLRKPPSLPVFAIGEATAQAAQKLGLSVVALPRKQFDSEDLLSHLHANLPSQTTALQRPVKVAILKGVGGRDALKQGLLAQGVEVIELPLYARQVATFCQAQWQTFIQANHSVLLVSSLESWQALLENFANPLEAMAPVATILVFSERIHQALLEQGIPAGKLSIVPIQSNLGILSALKTLS